MNRELQEEIDRVKTELSDKFSRGYCHPHSQIAAEQGYREALDNFHQHPAVKLIASSLSIALFELRRGSPNGAINIIIEAQDIFEKFGGKI